MRRRVVKVAEIRSYSPRLTGKAGRTGYQGVVYHRPYLHGKRRRLCRIVPEHGLRVALPQTGRICFFFHDP